MMATSSDTSRFSNSEDFANAISHLIGTFLSVAALVIMVIFSALRGNAWHIVSSSVFGTSLIMLYLSSTIAHCLPAGRKKDLFFIIDQAAIFILIAGTYTPLTLITLRGTLGWIIFGIEWGLAVFGVSRLLIRPGKFEDGVGIPDILIYTAMGWMVAFVAGPVLRSIHSMGFIWIIIGGLFYTIGIIFFKLTKFQYHHLIWHLMVIGGSASHFTAIFFYVLP
jgi:hemolysin III